MSRQVILGRECAHAPWHRHGAERRACNPWRMSAHPGSLQHPLRAIPGAAHSQGRRDERQVAVVQVALAGVRKGGAPWTRRPGPDACAAAGCSAPTGSALASVRSWRARRAPPTDRTMVGTKPTRLPSFRCCRDQARISALVVKTGMVQPSAAMVVSLDCCNKIVCRFDHQWACVMVMKARCC